MHEDMIETIAAERRAETAGDKLQPGEEFWVAGLGWITYTPKPRK